MRSSALLVLYRETNIRVHVAVGREKSGVVRRTSRGDNVVAIFKVCDDRMKIDHKNGQR
jgi:hypothetical protein